MHERGTDGFNIRRCDYVLMDKKGEGCLICGSPLTYDNVHHIRSCSLCQKICRSNSICSNGHYVCDACHSKGHIDGTTSICLSSESLDPIKILIELMDVPDVPMHGPEHHVMVGSALITAYHNATGELDLKTSLEEMRERGSQLPGGICGNWGSCGAAVSCGIAYSIITGTTPLSTGSWGLANLMTSRCLESISTTGGPRCCKRNSITSLCTAARFLEENHGVHLQIPDSIHCRFSHRNRQCLEQRCPHHNP